MKKIVFVSSMFRSGTTFVARMLNVHPEIVCASDPMRPLVNSFRFDLADDTYRSSHLRHDPLDDYFLQNTSLLDRILEADLSIPITESPRELLLAVQRRAEPFSGLYADLLDPDRTVGTYQDAVAYLLDLVEQSYANNRKNQIVAFKEVWANEFYPAMRRSFPGTKCLLIIRDPRSVVASKVATSEPYPLSFMGRHWRKLAWVTAYLRDAYPDDVLVMRYEDLVGAPESHVRRLCDFFGVAYDPSLLNTSLYKDGRQRDWKQNTSFSIEGSTGINTQTVERWRSLLTPTEIASLELYTYDWMKVFGYNPVSSRDELLNLGLRDYKRYRDAELAEWVRPFSFDEKEGAVESAILIEKLRLANSEHIPKHLRKGMHLAWWGNE